jgi:glutamine cyclotransferase
MSAAAVILVVLHAQPAQLYLLRAGPPTYSAVVVNSFPHDPSAFTQGLHMDPQGSTLIESTGLYGQSTVRRVDLVSGRVLQSERLHSSWFGEGLTVQAGRCIQLLWREGLALVRDPDTLKLRETLPLPPGIAEGWGITGDGRGSLFISDGTSTLHELDEHTFEVKRRLGVKANGRELPALNDLQWVHGEIWANLWHEEKLAVIQPSDGSVRCFVDLQNLLSPAERRALGGGSDALREEAVLNGIAYDEGARRLFVTGKCWPTIFEIETEALTGWVDPKEESLADE